MTEAPAEANVTLDARIVLDGGQEYLAEQAWLDGGRVHALRIRRRLTAGEHYGPPRDYRSWRSADVRILETST